VRILMFGRGVIASVYGWALESAGHHVEYYVRPGRVEMSSHGIELDLVDLRRRPWGEQVRTRIDTPARDSLSPDDGFDLVILSVSHHRLEEAAGFLAPRIGAATVLVFGNAWPDPEAAVAALPRDQVVWGFPGAGGGFQSDGSLRAGLLPSVKLAATDGPATPRGAAVRGAFRDAGIAVRAQPDFAGWLGVHFVADAGVHALGLRLGTMSLLVGNTAGLREALRTSQELLPLLEAKGIDLARHRTATAGIRHPVAVAPALGWVTAHLAPARISLEAHNDPGATEPRAVVRDALAEARRHGIRVPLLEKSEPLLSR
jgi:2-dehydropantoate 2-reductase